MSIVRIDSDTTHGWQARVSLEGKKAALSMLCSDSVHGGREKALRAAKKAERMLQLQARAIRRPDLLEELERLVPPEARTP